MRLRVGHISESRPDGYSFSDWRNTDFPHHGTGWIYRVTRQSSPCRCQDCSGSGCSQPKKLWWKCEVFTACHVVYDKREAERTKVDLYYDEENSEVTTLHGLDVEDNSEREDVCILQCAIHDWLIASRLLKCLRCYNRLNLDLESLMGGLCVVISHPHGRPKKVSVGQIVSKATYDPEDSRMTEYMYMYTTDNCKGSSGAPVLSAFSEKPPESRGVWPGAGPHSWGHVDGVHNQCGSGSFYVQASR